MSGRASWSVRPVGAADLPLLQAWAPAGTDLSLPPEDGPEAWLLAEGARGPLAALRLRGPVGLDRPRHWYHVGCVVHAAPELALFSRQGTLLLGNDHTGASELADRLHDPALDQTGLARASLMLLDALRQHLRRHRGAHGGRLVCGLRGRRDAQGHSPFWQGLGRPFFGGDVERLLGERGAAARAEIAALLPRQVIYTALLPEPVRAAMAQVDDHERGWMDLLAHQGFRYSHHIDILDGGPVVEAHLDSWCLGA